MDTHIFPADIRIFQMPHFTGSQTGGIHECNDCFEFQVADGRDKSPDFLFGWDIRKDAVKPAHGKLCCILGFVQDIERKEPELGDAGIDGSVR